MFCINISIIIIIYLLNRQSNTELTNYKSKQILAYSIQGIISASVVVEICVKLQFFSSQGKTSHALRIVLVVQNRLLIVLSNF